MNKVMDLHSAAQMIPSGCMLALGGSTLYRRPLAFVRALIEHFQQSAVPDSLTLLAFTAGLESDLLVGAGMVRLVRTCYFGLEIFGLAPMFTYMANRGLLKISEETEASLAFGLRAKMAGVGFMPGRGWLGTDLPGLRPDVHTVIDPYSGEELMAFPAIAPDWAVIHALRADPDGNAQIGEHHGVDIELSVASKNVIVTAEEIVPALDKADIVAPFVHAVVPAAHGAWPTSCHPIYPLDGLAFLDYTEKVSDPETYQQYISSSFTKP